MFGREVALYQELQRRGVRVSFITFGDHRDLHYAEQIPGIDIHCNRWHLPAALYERWLPRLHRRVLKTCDVIKTNQTNGADLALQIARQYGKPLVARCGYMWSEFAARQLGEDDVFVQQVKAVEAKVFTAADRVVVTTPMMAADVANRIPAAAAKTSVIPNYVDTQTFAPGNAPKDIDLIFIGRIDRQKNVGALLEAVRPLDHNLVIIGSGALRGELAGTYGDLDGRLRWIDKLPNEEIPNYLRRAKVFVLPSHYEGHPKTLVEAMACGSPAIGTIVPGIQEVITHGENGWLCHTDAASIRAAVQKLLADAGLRAKLGANARSYALEHYALTKIADRELVLLQECIHDR
jgi:glycosyltransferase involved in cell wall biosynthesis